MQCRVPGRDDPPSGEAVRRRAHAPGLLDHERHPDSKSWIAVAGDRKSSGSRSQFSAPGSVCALCRARRLVPVGTIIPQAPSSAPSRSSRPSRRSRSNGPGSDSSPVLSGREAEAGIIRRVAEQDHRAMAARLGGRQRVLHQRSSDAELAAGRIDRQRPQHQRRHAPGADVPQPHGPDQPAVGARAESARPSAGARPSRRRWQVRAWRLAPKQASSSASRAATSRGALGSDRERSGVGREGQRWSSAN